MKYTPILNRTGNGSFQHPADGWYQIEPLGNHPNRPAGVVQVIDAEAAQSIVNRFNADAAAGHLRQGSEMLIDHEHFSDQPDQETRAYGWLQQLQNRADGIYGRIRWTTTGQAAVDGGDYRFFSTEYNPGDVCSVEPAAQNSKAPRLVRPMRLGGLSLTNMNNNRGQKPITNRNRPLPPVPANGQCPDCACGLQAGSTAGLMTCPGCQNNFAVVSAPANSTTKTPVTNRKMKTVCTLLGLSADAEETSVHAAVTKLLNRGDIAPDALATLRTEHQTLGQQNTILLTEQAESILDSCGVKDAKVRNRLGAGLKLLTNREERLGYLADFGYEPGKPGEATATAAAARQVQLRNRDTRPPAEAAAASGKADQASADRIMNRARAIQKETPNTSLPTAVRMAQREVENTQNAAQ